MVDSSTPAVSTQDKGFPTQSASIDTGHSSAAAPLPEVSDSLPEPTVPLPTAPPKRLIPKTEASDSPLKKQKTKSRVSVSKGKAKAPVQPSRRMPLRQSVRKATLLKEEVKTSLDSDAIDLSDSDDDGSPPPAFLSRYAVNRRLLLQRDRKYPELKTSSVSPFSNRFISQQAAARYQVLSSRLFNNMRVLPPDDKNLSEAQAMVTAAGLLLTLTEIDCYTEEVVKEFYANLPEMETLGDEEYAVYIRGCMFEFHPRLLNQLFQLEHHPYPLNVSLLSIPENLSLVVEMQTGGKYRKWSELTSPRLTDKMAVLNKFCCRNWMPTMNKGALNKERARLIFLVANRRELNFGKLIFDQIRSCSHVVANESANFRMILPNLIDQLLRFQRVVPALSGDTDSPKPEVFRHTPVVSTPAGISTSGPSSVSASLSADLAQLMTFLQTMQQRLTGKYSHFSSVLCPVVFDVLSVCALKQGENMGSLYQLLYQLVRMFQNHR